MTINYARNSGIATLEPLYGTREAASIVDRLLLDCFGISLLDRVMMGDSREIDSADFEKLMARLSDGEPVQYVVGFEEFCGLRFDLNSDTLIPRIETQELVGWILERHSPQDAVRILDVGSGSGAIAVSLAHSLGNGVVRAMDISPSALEMARSNAARNGAAVDFFEQDIFEYTPQQGEYDLIVSNPPYVLNSEKALMHNNVLEHEPHRALFVEDNDPLIFYRQIAKVAQVGLVSGGELFFEINEAFGRETCTLMQELGFVDIELREDLHGKERMVCGKKR